MIDEGVITENLARIGTAFRKIRRYKGLTLDEVGAEVGMSKARLSLIENGKVAKGATICTYLQLIAFYGCKLELYGEGGDKEYEFVQTSKDEEAPTE